MLEYGNIFSGDTLPCWCSCKGPGWLGLARSPVQGPALCLEFCNRDWPRVRGIQGGKACQTYIYVHVHTLAQTLLQSCCFGFNLPLELEEAARGCNGVQQESVSRQHKGGTRGIRARPGEGKGRSQKDSKNALVSITVFASFSLESTSVSASWELQVSWFSFSPAS